MGTEFSKSETNIVSNLYTLRAGLSVISQEKDKVDKIIAEGKSRQDDIKNNAINALNANKKIAQQKIDEAKKGCADANLNIKQYEKELQETVDEIDSNNKKIHPLFFDILFNNILRRILTILLYIVLIGIALIPVVFAIITDVTYANNIIYKSAAANWLFGVDDGIGSVIFVNIFYAVVAAVLLGLFFFLTHKASDWWWDALGRYETSISDKIAFKSNAKRTLKQCRNEIPNIKKRIEQAKAYFEQQELNYKHLIDLSDKILKEAEATFNADINKANETLKSAYRQAMPHVQAAVNLIQSLNNSFGYMIDMRDWANTDFIIYSLETRRADTMKEALAIVDSEKRANRIAAAINQASIEIRRSIISNSAEIIKSLQGGFNRLSNIMVTQAEIMQTTYQSINAQTQIMANEMQATRAAIGSQSTYLSQIACQTNMQNALIAKANESSASLAQKADTMNQYAHKLAYGV